jgi:hypothetical protein
MALGSQIKLDEHDKDRLTPDHLFSLALGQIIVLTQRDKDRLTPCPASDG